MNDKSITPAEANQGLLAANAEFFAQSLAPLSTVFGNTQMLRIVSEEADSTVVVGMQKTEEEGVMDVDCIFLDANQESLKECIHSLFL